MLSGPRNTVISSEMVELWEISRMRGSKKNTESFWSAFRQNDEEESLISPEKDAFEIFDQAHGAYHFSELPFSSLNFETSSSCATKATLISLLLRID